MRKLICTGAAAIAALASTPAAHAQGLPGGWTSENVEYVGNFPMAGELAEGGRLVGDVFFATADARGFVALDVSDPEHPVELASVRLPHFLENEDIATDGRILLLSQGSAPTYFERANTRRVVGRADGSLLHVFDVSDPRAPKRLATVPGAGDHGIECVLGCTWAYGASGQIVDLRNPASPVVLDKLWTVEMGLPDFNPAHDLTEVSPGILLSASTPMLLIDARDPANPERLAASPITANTFHSTEWPHAPGGRIALSTSEAYINARCETRDFGTQTLGDGSDSAIRSWDTSNWRQTGTFTPLHDYRVSSGSYGDGDPAFSQAGIGGCSAHWFDVHPRFAGGGLLAEASYGHGVKFVRVRPDGSFVEAGHFLGYAADVSAAYWISDEIVYAVDFNRGIDILRFTGDTAPRGKAVRGSSSWVAHRPPSRAAVRRMARGMGPGARLATIYCLLGKVAG